MQFRDIGLSAGTTVRVAAACAALYALCPELIQDVAIKPDTLEEWPRTVTELEEASAVGFFLAFCYLMDAGLGDMTYITYELRLMFVMWRFIMLMTDKIIKQTPASVPAQQVQHLQEQVAQANDGELVQALAAMNINDVPINDVDALAAAFGALDIPDEVLAAAAGGPATGH